VAQPQLGRPKLIRFVERQADQVPKTAGWPGLLVGDIAQPRGGPMLTGHTSYQGSTQTSG
jgi:penicillin-insensitive murein endopeptidase